MTEKLQFAFDLDTADRFVKGILTVEPGLLRCDVDGKTLYTLETAGISDLKAVGDVGCGYLSCQTGGKDRILCRMTMRLLKNAGEFVKAFQYYQETEELNPVVEEQPRHCPKCGRPYPEDSSTCMYCVKTGAILVRALRLMKPYMKNFLIGCGMTSISTLFYAITPVLLRLLIDGQLSSGNGTVTGILLLCGGMLLVRSTGEGVFIFGSRFLNRAGSYFANELRHTAYSKIQALSIASLSRKTSGDLLKRVTQDTQKVREFLVDQGRWLFEMSITFICIGVILFVSNWKLALLVVLPAPVALWIATQVWSRIMLKYERQWRLFSRANSILHDIIQGIRVVKAFGNEEREIGKFSKACRDLAQVSAENERMYAKLFPGLNFLMGIGEFFVLYFGGRMVLNRDLTVGELLQFTMYIGMIYGPMRWMASLPRWLADVMTSLLKLFEILDEKPEIQDTLEPMTQPIAGEIEFDNVVFGYKSYEPVLKNINLKIKPGEMIGLVGPSGTGKSTMINLVMRLYDVGSGTLRIDGTDIRRISQKNLHESVGVVFQENFLFAGTIYDNLAYAKPEAAVDEIIAAAKIANAHEFIIALPDGYNTQVGQHGYTLSGGERQRVAIARAILRDPAILILDEATSSLDVETEAKIQEALGRLIKGRTTIAIAHRLSTLRGADRLVVLDGGRMVECGTHGDLMRADGVYRRLVMAQLQTQKSAK